MRRILIALLLMLSGCAPGIPVCMSGLAPMDQAELFFGGSISAAQWQNFVNQEVTPRFPDGFTVTDTQGQWRDRESMISRETGHELLIIIPSAPGVESSFNEIREAYKRRFMQESVLLVELSVCGAF